MVESQRERCHQQLFSKAGNGDLSQLLLPSGNKFDVTTFSLRELNRSSYRKVIRTFSTIQFNFHGLRPQTCGPTVWSLSAGIIAKGGSTLLTACKEVGLTATSKVMNEFKTAVINEKLMQKPEESVCSSLNCVFAHDNIDADLHQTAISRGMQTKSFHGTASIAQQTVGVESLKTHLRHTPLGPNIKSASDMVQDRSMHVRESQALALGIISVFGENFLTTNPQFGTTLGYIFKHVLKGHAPQETAIIEHLSFMDMPSNSRETTEKVLESYLKKLRHVRIAKNPTFFAVADMVSPYPDAFMNNTGEGPRPPHKAKFWTTVQDHICAAGNSFIFFGYPDLYGSHRTQTSSQNMLPTKLLYAIDLMNYVHTPVDH